VPRFRHIQKRSVPALNLAAMPDLIFTVLFFFMLVTHMRDVSPQVRYTVPQGHHLEKSRSTGLLYLFIGRPIDAAGRVVGSEPCIQLNDRIVTLEQLPKEIEQQKAQMTDDARSQLTVTIRADRDTPMGLITDVKQALRRAGALHVNYSATLSRSQQTNN